MDIILNLNTGQEFTVKLTSMRKLTVTFVDALPFVPESLWLKSQWIARK